MYTRPPYERQGQGRVRRRDDPAGSNRPDVCSEGGNGGVGRGLGMPADGEEDKDDPSSKWSAHVAKAGIEFRRHMESPSLPAPPNLLDTLLALGEYPLCVSVTVDPPKPPIPRTRTRTRSGRGYADEPPKLIMQKTYLVQSASLTASGTMGPVLLHSVEFCTGQGQPLEQMVRASGQSGDWRSCFGRRLEQLRNAVKTALEQLRNAVKTARRPRARRKRATRTTRSRRRRSPTPSPTPRG